jgi:hypothetical protein
MLTVVLAIPYCNTHFQGKASIVWDKFGASPRKAINRAPMNHLGRVGSDTGSRDSSPLNFAQKTGISLTFLHVQLTDRQSAQNFDHVFFAHLKGEFNPRFRGFFGTNWDKSATTAAPLLRESELAVLIETRKSRAIQAPDLVEVLYQNDGERARGDLRNLTAQGLIETKTLNPPRSNF